MSDLSLRSVWRPALLTLVVGGMLAVVVRSALAGPNLYPRDVDEVAAERVEDPPAGTDLRLQRPDGEWIGALGVVEPARPESRLSPAVSGVIERIVVNEGDFVEPGTLLLELESGTERAALAAAEAELLVAQAELARTRAGQRREDQLALEREADAARVQASRSQAIFERLERAAAGGGVTDDELDRARLQAEQDRLTAEQRSAQLDAGRRGRPVDVRLSRAQVEAAEARRDEAQARLDQRRLVAPLAGEVLEIHYRVGELIPPTAPEQVVIVGDTRSLRARVDVDERDVNRVAEGARALLVVDANPAERFDARVVEVGRRMGRKNIRTDEPTERIDTKILEVVVEIDEPEGLIVGQRVMAYLAPADAERSEAE